MSVETDIEEDIVEVLEDGSAEEYDDDDGGELSKQEVLEGTLGRLKDDKTKLVHTPRNDIGTITAVKENLSDSELKPVNRKTNLKTDAVDKTTIAIINYSSTLAEDVLKEALLIADIHTRDSLNISDALKEDTMERDQGIRKQLFPSENGRIPTSDKTGGYDSYLLDKLLRSQPDPAELEGTEGFDGKEENFKIDLDQMYPGLDRDDAYVKSELDRTDPARPESDKNNNQPGSGLIDPFEENLLQTIHEDKELVIEENFNIADLELAPLAGDHVDTTRDQSTDQAETSLHKTVLDKESAEDMNDSGNVEDLQVIDEVGAGGEPVDVSDEDDEESDCCEMTFKQKKVMVYAVRRGDIGLLERLLEKKNADMNMKWFGENLLMVAIRAQQPEMGEFLVDNGVAWDYERKLVELDENGSISVQKLTARQMAFDANMEDLVEILDHKTGNLFPFIKPKPRAPRLRQPIIPFQPPALDEGIRAEFLITPEQAIVWQKETRKLHFERLREAAIEAELQEQERINAQRKKRGLIGAEDESVQMSKSRQTFSDMNVLNDDISNVFGPDEGYETMSPVSHYHKDYKYHVTDVQEPVSIRGTRTFHLKKAFNASKAGQLKRMDSPDYPMHNNNMIESIGSYTFESRQWHHPRSAPQYRNYSVESLADSGVHIGLPFLHSGSVKSGSARSRDRPAQTSFQSRRTKSAHTNISPFSQVARLLEQSRLFSPIISSRPSTTSLPTISNKKSSDLTVTKTRINYIYANRSSAKSSRDEAAQLRNELLPRRKVIAR